MNGMDQRKILKEQYKEIKIEAGIYTITNKQTGDIYIGSLNNLKRLNGIIFQLNTGTHMHKNLQQSWKEQGESAFECVVREILKEEVIEEQGMKEALEKTQEKWSSQLGHTISLN